MGKHFIKKNRIYCWGIQKRMPIVFAIYREVRLFSASIIIASSKEIRIEKVESHR